LSIRTRLLIVLGGAILVGMIGYCGIFGPPVVSVQNLGDTEIQVAQLKCQNSETTIDSILPRSTQYVLLSSLQGECGLRLSYRINGKTFEHEDLAYLESIDGYCADLAVKDEKILKKSSGFLCFRWQRLV
jgi:hypothetical protein